MLPAGETLLANTTVPQFQFTITLWYAMLRGVKIVTLADAAGGAEVRGSKAEE